MTMHQLHNTHSVQAPAAGATTPKFPGLAQATALQTNLQEEVCEVQQRRVQPCEQCAACLQELACVLELARYHRRGGRCSQCLCMQQHQVAGEPSSAIKCRTQLPLSESAGGASSCVECGCTHMLTAMFTQADTSQDRHCSNQCKHERTGLTRDAWKLQLHTCIVARATNRSASVAGAWLLQACSAVQQQGAAARGSRGGGKWTEKAVSLRVNASQPQCKPNKSV